MTNQQETKARIQYSSRDALDVAVIDYCRGQSRHDLHYRTRQALNGFYAPFAIATSNASPTEIRQQALRSIRQLTTQILEIQTQFLPELLRLEDGAGGLSSARVAIAQNEVAIATQDPKITIPSSVAPSDTEKSADSGPVDAQLRAFLGEDAAIMAGLNPFINDLT